ncbi:CBS domain-containing protein [Nocardioides sp.]|uniref:CBS domain-containing protein n=1 Tax=Nocardioides sp. TaxID=35761 RepID=UPI0027345596|nr:CBS domain-containing protein [Nocardioides sp.]MDP3889754.1 CBS domain-containing protein [Nocardioides sp.]
MTSARDIMTAGAECAQVGETLVEVARKMRDHGIGALPICGEDNRLHGVITDRDVVVRCLAEGGDPSTSHVRDFAGATPVTVGADDPVEEALRTMTEHGVRRLPVIDGHDLVGIISQADIAQELGDARTGELVEAISAAPANN